MRLGCDVVRRLSVRYVRCRTEIDSFAAYSLSSGPAPVVSVAFEAAPLTAIDRVTVVCRPRNALINARQWSDRMRKLNL
jgi:hypothetical protein